MPSVVHSRRVLVVHGEPAFAATLTKAFGALGFVVDIAIDCRAAVERVKLERPTIVCVSLNLPRESGYELCEMIRNNPDLDQVQILVISDRNTPEVIAYAEEAGANAFLARPFKLDLLEEYVTAMLEVPQAATPYEAVTRAVGDGIALE